MHKGDFLKAAGITVAEATEVDGGLLRLRARFDSDDVREQLVKTLVEQGFGIRSVVDLESDLEALFLQLTGDASSSSAAGGAGITQAGGVA